MDINSYFTFVLYAVYGKLAIADQLLRLYHEEIYATADAMRRQFGPATLPKLYRGLVVDAQDVDGEVLKPQLDVEFVSFSEKRDCAEWFADPRSIMNEYMLEHKPLARGYLIEHQAKPEDVLYHWSWAHKPVGGGVTLAFAARMHPQIDVSQFMWNNSTQHEVLVKPVGDMIASPYESTRTAELDELFTHPKFKK